MNAKDRVRRLLEVLDKTRTSWHGPTPRDVDARLGRHRGYVSRVCSGRIALQVETLFELLEVLDVEPEVFAARAIGTPATVDAERLLALVERQGRDRGPALLESIEHGLGDYTAAPAATGDQLRRRLSELDALRFADALGAEEQLPPVLELAAALAAAEPADESRELLCRTLGTAGSIYRTRARLSAAARCFRLGLRLARGQSCELLLRGDLLQRSAYLIGDDGEHAIGAEVARQAVEAYVLADDRQGIGKALVTLANLLVHAGELIAGVRTFKSSLCYVPAGAWQYRISVFHGLASVQFFLGEEDEAARSIATAKSLFPQPQGLAWAKVIWLEGEIAFRRGDLGTAQEALRAACRTIAESGDRLDAVLISLRLARVLLSAGRRSELGEIASAMMGWATDLRHNKIARAAIDEFIVAVLRGEMTQAVAERLERQIEKAGAPGWGHPERETL